MIEAVKYKIKLEDLAVVTVSKQHLFKRRWIKFFGGVDKVHEFIKNYK